MRSVMMPHVKVRVDATIEAFNSVSTPFSSASARIAWLDIWDLDKISITTMPKFRITSHQAQMMDPGTRVERAQTKNIETGRKRKSISRLSDLRQPERHKRFLNIELKFEKLWSQTLWNKHNTLKTNTLYLNFKFTVMIPAVKSQVKSSCQL